MLHHKILNIRRAKAFVLLVAGVVCCFLKVEQLCAGISSKEDIEVYHELIPAAGFWQTSDWISADTIIAASSRERKSLDEIEIMTGFHNFVDYQTLTAPPMIWWKHSYYWVNTHPESTSFSVLYFDPFNVLPTEGYPLVRYRIKDSGAAYNSLTLPFVREQDGGRLYGAAVSLSTGVWEYQYVAKNPERAQEYRLELSSFVVSSRPSQFENTTGIANNQVVPSARIVLSWSAVDPDLSGSLRYKVYFGTDTASMVVIYEGYATSCEVMRLEAGKEYLWQVEATNVYGVTAKSVVWKFKTIERLEAGKAFNYPNPFNPKDKTNIVFDMAKDGEAEVSVFTEFGDLCWRRSFYGLLKGTNEITYDGRDDSGRVLYSGPYVVIIKKTYSLDGSESRDRCRLLIIK